MDIILAAALATCATDPSVCTFEQTETETIVYVCDIAPEKVGEPIILGSTLPQGEVTFVLSPKCKNF